MKYLFLILAIIISLHPFAQDSLEASLSKKICSCLIALKNINKENSGTCIDSTFDNNQELIIERAKELYNDPSFETGAKFGRELMFNISAGMMFTCDVFYHYMDTMRFSIFRSLNKDSIRKAITNSGNDKKDAGFFARRGALYLQLMDLDHSIQDFESAIRLDSSASQIMYYKALALELKKDYDGALSVYTDLVSLTKKNEFRIFAEIVKRKKSEL